MEKRQVMRDGRVPMMQKNLLKRQQKQVELQRRQEGWLQEKEAQREELARQARAARPMKIKASSYMNERSSNATVIQGKGQTKALNIQF